jgi:5'-nucleotidase
LAYETNRGPVPVNPAFPQFAPRADIATYVARYVAAARESAGRRIGNLDRAATTAENGRGMGGTLGNLVADAHLEATRSSGAQIAFTNPFGLRASLSPAADGTVTFADIYAVLPFANELVTIDLTGKQIVAALEQGFDERGPEQALAASRGFAFAFDRSRPSGQRIVSAALDGRPLDPSVTYRVTLNAFLANGGDTFTHFAEGTNRATGPIDVDALEAWIKAVPIRPVPQEDRATAVSLAR